jgi:DNA-binding SARP family transcriptional activator
VLLLEAPSSVAVAQIADRVWDDAGVPAGRIHTYIGQLRAALKPVGVGIDHDGAGYRIDIDPLRVDVHRFRELVQLASAQPDDATSLIEEALSLWQPRAFDWTRGTWLQTYGQRLHEELLAATLRRNAGWLAAGRHEALVDLLPSMLAEHPLDERLAEQYLRALYLSGYIGPALTFYSDFYRRMVEAQGRPPGPALRGLHLRVLRQDAPPEPEDWLPRPPRPATLPPLVAALGGIASWLGCGAGRRSRAHRERFTWWASTAHPGWGRPRSRWPGRTRSRPSSRAGHCMPICARTGRRRR